MMLRCCTVDPRQEVLDDGSDPATQTSQRKKKTQNDQSTALGTFSEEEARGGRKEGKGTERSW